MIANKKNLKELIHKKKTTFEKSSFKVHPQRFELWTH